MVYEYTENVAPLPEISIWELLFEQNEHDRNTKILLDADDPSQFYTLGSITKQVLKLGGLLKQKYQWKDGEVLAVCADNHIDYIAAVHACVSIGGMSSAADQNNNASEIASDFQLVGAALVVTDDKHRSKVVEAAKKAGVPKGVVTFKELRRMLQNEKIDSAEPKRYSAKQLETTPAYLYFTSGTSGGPKKAVMLSHRNVIAILSTMANDDPAPNSRALAYTDFHHVSQLILPMHYSIFHAMPHYIMRTSEAHLDVKRICEVTQKYAITTQLMQPYLGNYIAKAPWVDDYDLSSVQYVRCGGAKLDMSIIKGVYERLGIKVIDVYGQTECLATMRGSWEATLRGSAGRLAPRCQVKIMDDEGKEVPPGEIGELWIKSPAVTIGYYRNEEATKATIDEEGYLHSGDLFRESEGYFYFSGRKKELIKYYLTHIYPRDIETVLNQHPSVGDCTVMGVYDPEKATELVTAFVVPDKQKIKASQRRDELEQEIRDFVDSRVPDPQRIRGGVHIMESFPRTAMGKVLKQELRKMIT
ncbi:hypothetical protein BCR43DRAFT_512011 [Syncephalastrum racemosum]|uniref:AMP-dependent synthetase/ligase domain-containing protein n=1 Tax=Syncephalastrum racemosum TaxID=13706 RepID=A0A1X2HP36_SYNRA|nr:hypothetical protein BCR43DRAFT_512011 [Syncephalastrum racemosum]